MEFGGARALTAGMALFGAAAVAVASVPAIEAMPTAISSMALPRVENARIDLTTATADLYKLGVGDLGIEALNRLGGSVVAAPLAALIVVLDLVNGDNTSAYAQLKQFVDAPQYINDPLIVAFSDLVPSALGGGQPTAGWNVDPTGQPGLIQFRDNVMVNAWRNDADAILGILMGVPNATQIPDFNAAASLISLVVNEPTTVLNNFSTGLADLNKGLQSVFSSGDIAGIGAIGTGLNELVNTPLDAVRVVLTTLANAVPKATTAPLFNAIAANVKYLEDTVNFGISSAFPTPVSATTSTAAVAAAKAVTSTAAVAAVRTTGAATETPSSAPSTTKSALPAAKTALAAAKTALSAAKSQQQADTTTGAPAASSAKAQVKADKTTVKVGKSSTKSDKTSAKVTKGK